MWWLLKELFSCYLNRAALYEKMAARKLCRETQLPLKALYFFPEEGKTGIAPTRLIVEKKGVAVGVDVNINWQGEHVPAKIIALSGK